MSLSLLYLTKADVAATGYTMEETLAVLDEIYREKAAGNYELPPKIGVHPGGEQNYLHAMPCWAHKWQTAGLKWGGGFQNNPGKGLDYISGHIILNDVETGVPYVMMDATWPTALRTGGKSAISAKYLAKKDASTLAMMACGKQARRALEAFYYACPQVKTIWCWDFYPEAAEKYAAEMKAQFPTLDLRVTTSVAEAVGDADIIHTAAPVVQEDIGVIEKGMVKPGVVATAMDCYTLWKTDAVTELFSKFYSDDVPQYLAFNGRPEYKGIDVVPTELASVISGKDAGRESDSENIFVANLGNAFDDMPVARAVYELAKQKGLGRMITL